MEKKKKNNTIKIIVIVMAIYFLMVIINALGEGASDISFNINNDKTFRIISSVYTKKMDNDLIRYGKKNGINVRI